MLPHLNPGVLSWAELQRLRPVAPSMGMMLETTSTRLFTHRGEAHYGSPDKDPAVRLRVLEDAGRLNIPFTTGALVGIGETTTELAETIFALRATARRYHAVQEVIVQNFRAKPGTAMRATPDLGLEEYLASIAVTRVVLGPSARVQAPPNLTDAGQCRRLLDAGVDDWGGVSPLTPDHVNPERPWPSLQMLQSITAEAGLHLRARLTVHPEYVHRGEPWIDPRVAPHVAALAGPDGLARPGVIPAGLPWQEPDGGLATTGRSDLHVAVDTQGRQADRRGDFDDVYGDWDEVRADAQMSAAGDRGGSSPRRCGSTMDPAQKAALAAAEHDPACLQDEHALTLMTAEGELLDRLCALADDLRRETVGDVVSYVVNRNINFTNVCYSGC
ncbi:MAG: 7,8-didemethyl-8-hydroxy-5-deazariboflavin synthase subunit CofG, partial [Micrococcales bacterium]